MYVYVIGSILFLVGYSTGDTKVWLHSTDIYDKQNWENGTVQNSCDGLVFSEDNRALINIDQLNVKRVILPKSGWFQFQSGSKIVFDENSKDELNCVKLKPLADLSAADYRQWNNTDDPDNPAIPYVERVPSRFDDVVLPRGFSHSGVMLLGMQVKSITIGEKNGQKQTFRSNIELRGAFSEMSFYEMLMHLVSIGNEDCKDVTGCTIGKEQLCSTDSFSAFLSDNENQLLDCQNPIKPIFGFCGLSMCGAAVVISDLKPGFRLDRINKKLKEYTSYTHASKTSDKIPKLQIIFAEKGYTGQSVVDATEFYNMLQEDDSYFCGNITLQASGSPLRAQSEFIRNFVSVTFGTLLGVIVIFGLLFLVYSPTIASLNLRNRLLSSRPISTYILRYDNIEDRGYIIDSQSAAGSVEDLNRSFENPLYEQASSTRSTSNETIASVRLEGKQGNTDDRSMQVVDVEVEVGQELEEIKERKEAEDVKEDALLKDL